MECHASCCPKCVRRMGWHHALCLYCLVQKVGLAISSVVNFYYPHSGSMSRYKNNLRKIEEEKFVALWKAEEESFMSRLPDCSLSDHDDYKEFLNERNALFEQFLAEYEGLLTKKIDPNGQNQVIEDHGFFKGKRFANCGDKTILSNYLILYFFQEYFQLDFQNYEVRINARSPANDGLYGDHELCGIRVISRLYSAVDDNKQRLIDLPNPECFFLLDSWAHKFFTLEEYLIYLQEPENLDGTYLKDTTINHLQCFKKQKIYFNLLIAQYPVLKQMIRDVCGLLFSS